MTIQVNGNAPTWVNSMSNVCRFLQMGVLLGARPKTYAAGVVVGFAYNGLCKMIRLDNLSLEGRLSFVHKVASVCIKDRFLGRIPIAFGTVWTIGYAVKRITPPLAKWAVSATAFSQGVSDGLTVPNYIFAAAPNIPQIKKEEPKPPTLVNQPGPQNNSNGIPDGESGWLNNPETIRWIDKEGMAHANQITENKNYPFENGLSVMENGAKGEGPITYPELDA